MRTHVPTRLIGEILLFKYQYSLYTFLHQNNLYFLLHTDGLAQVPEYLYDPDRYTGMSGNMVTIMITNWMKTTNENELYYTT